MEKDAGTGGVDAVCRWAKKLGVQLHSACMPPVSSTVLCTVDRAVIPLTWLLSLSSSLSLTPSAEKERTKPHE